MSWQVSDQEYESVAALPAPKRYSYFVKKIADWEEVWSLRNDDGWVLSGSDSGEEVVPVWPHERFARACASGQWDDCEPAQIELEAWMERWLPGMAKDNKKAGVFPSSQDKGMVVEPGRLKDDLAEACEDYE